MDCSIKCSRKSLKKKSRSGVKSLPCQCVRRRAQHEGFFQYRSVSGRILKKSRVGSDQVEMLKYSIGYSRVPHFSRVFPGMLSMSGIKGKLDIYQNRKGLGWVSKIMSGCGRVLGSCWVLVRSFSWKIISCV